MQETQILSGFQPVAAEPSASARPALVFDACQAGVILRAVLFVEVAVAVAALFGAQDSWDWLTKLALWTGGALPAVLVWLLAACSLKRSLARLRQRWQNAAGVALGALAGLYGCGMLALIGVVEPAPWGASAAAGAWLSALIVAGLVLRARARTPAATTARLGELQARIRPHFLFNTLNSAIALVRAEPARAEALLEDLSDLFRHALVDQGESVSLEQETTLAERYLSIEQVRFGERLRVQWSLDPRAAGAELPPLLLQPLVENAVKHGVEPSASGADLHISTERRGSTVVIKISNTVPGGQGAPGHGLALDNVRDRLNLLHDVHSQFQAGLKDGVYQVRMELPL
ncbi:two-component system sensor histidine kinase AlgZ [Rhodoferax ferrireducens]|uniref:Two-component system sensor histidine kinase AlgZ n=1 Tax=Rhodoferax ferrireducens TaxID=192843 RepID=A0ABU2C1Z4_9BURK|nr:histidine kinase [Rhodoferax ferrireducens]MDR7375348.1 two-component system sensor histidine kinase AlgZ [Rhodoferax ferrireducens]